MSGLRSSATAAEVLRYDRPCTIFFTSHALELSSPFACGCVTSFIRKSTYYRDDASLSTPSTPVRFFVHGIKPVGLGLLPCGLLWQEADAHRAAVEKDVRAELKLLKRLRDAGVESWKEVLVKAECIAFCRKRLTYIPIFVSAVSLTATRIITLNRENRAYPAQYQVHS